MSLLAAAGRGGCTATGVRQGTPAEKAGLREGDVIVQMAGVRIKNLHDLGYVPRSKRAGDTAEVVFLRSGHEFNATATLEQRR